MSDTSVASISDNGFLQGLSNGVVQVWLTIGGLRSADFELDIANANLVSINGISGASELERCLPQRYYATGTYSDGTNRNLSNVTWAVDDANKAELFETNGASTQLNAQLPGPLALSASVSGAIGFNQPLLVTESLLRVVIGTLSISLDEGDQLNVNATGFYDNTTAAATEELPGVDITENVSWVVLVAPENLSVSDVRGTKGLLTGDDEGGAAIMASCGDINSLRAAVTINAEGSSTDLAIEIGGELVEDNLITLSLAAEGLAPIALLVSTGTEYDDDNDITSTVSFQVQAYTSIPAIELLGNLTDTPTISLKALGDVTLVATQTEDGDTVETITVRVIN